MKKRPEKFTWLRKKAYLSFMSIAFLSLQVSSFAQTNTVTHAFGSPNSFAVNVKNYSTEIVTGTNNETVMAGTMFDQEQPFNRVHFLHIDQFGGILKSVVYDDPDYIDQRAVDIVAANIQGNDLYIITCLVRASPDMPNPADRIKIIVVDVDGIVYAEDVIEEAAPYTGMGMYPLHSIMHNNNLFICGYQLDIYQDPYTEPDLASGPRKAFVIKYDPSNMTLLNNKTFDYTSTFFNIQPIQKDYDMAVKLVPLTDGSNNIFVAGAVNSVRNTYKNMMFPPYPNGETQTHSSGMMNLVIDDNLNVVTDYPFQNSEKLAPFTGEYSISLVQDVGNNRNYIIANSIDNRSLNTPVGMHLLVNYIPGNFTRPVTGKPQAYFIPHDGTRAMQAFQSPRNVPGPKFTLTIAGLESAYGCFPVGLEPTQSNENPFLTDMTFELIGDDIFGSVGQWVTYLNQTGTGNIGLPNSFAVLGDNLTSRSFNDFAARASVFDDYNLSAPKWTGTASSGILSMKSIRSRATDFTVPACPGSYQQFFAGDPCIDVFYTSGVTDISSIGVPPYPDQIVMYNYGMLNLTNVTSQSASYNFTYRDTYCNVNTPVFKQNTTGINDVNIEGKVTLFPNPASKVVEVKFDDIITGNNVHIVLTNIYGQVISIMYDGKATGTQKIQLPDVANGVYFVKVSIDNQQVQSEKLIIQNN